jgi:hypothetical protein
MTAPKNDFCKVAKELKSPAARIENGKLLHKKQELNFWFDPTVGTHDYASLRYYQNPTRRKKFLVRPTVGTHDYAFMRFPKIRPGGIKFLVRPTVGTHLMSYSVSNPTQKINPLKKMIKRKSPAKYQN